MIGSIGSSTYANMFPPRLADLNSNLPGTSATNGAASTAGASNVGGVSLATEVPGHSSLPNVTGAPSVAGVSDVSPNTVTTPTGGADFGTMLSNAVGSVNSTMQNAEVQKAKVMSGETNNLHQAMISMQEANVAFSLMTEVRNKLVESYQEVMKMQA